MDLLVGTGLGIFVIVYFWSMYLCLHKVYKALSRTTGKTIKLYIACFILVLVAVIPVVNLLVAAELL